jgi:hypothetical protein
MFDYSNQLIFFEHWHGEYSADAAQFNCINYHGMTLGI